jgi:CHAT domain-containing protein
LPQDSRVAHLVFDIVFRIRGLGSEMLARDRRMFLEKASPEARAELEKLRTLHERIASELEGDPMRAAAEGVPTRVYELQMEIRQSRARLTALQSRWKTRPPKLDALAALESLLTGDQGLIEILHATFEHQQRAEHDVDLFMEWKHGFYVLFFVSARDPGRIQWQAVAAREVHSISRPLIEAASSDEGMDQLPFALYELLLSSFSGLDTCKQLVIAPDGQLTTVPFELLRSSAGVALLEQSDIRYLLYGRELLIPPSATSPGPSVVMGAPDFDALGEPVEGHARLEMLRAAARGTESKPPPSYEPLPSARTEALEVASILEVTAALGGDAHRQALLKVRSPRVLHLVTHGFGPEMAGMHFGWDQVRDGPSGTAAALLGESRVASKSGLILAGANWRAQSHRHMRAAMQQVFNAAGRPHLDSASDAQFAALAKQAVTEALSVDVMRGPRTECGKGTVTAADITWMDLRGTRLVVLSGCQTALGLREPGDSMGGLLRSFRIAGAHSVICALWKVPDRHTTELMRILYSELMAGAACDEALQRAKRRMARVYPQCPSAWAGFVCYGSGRTYVPHRRALTYMTTA